MAVRYKILVSLAFAGAVVFAAAVGGLWWFQVHGFAWLEARGLAWVMLPGVLAALFGLGFVWYRLFVWSMGFLRVDLDD
jgi:hypothetical protein